MKKVYPLLITEKLADCAAFYKEILGFDIVFQEDWYIHLVHQESGMELAFMAPNVESQPQELHAGFSGAGMVYSFEVEDAEGEYQRISALEGIKMILTLRDEPWGQRHFILRDPAGIHVDVVQQLES